MVENLIFLTMGICIGLLISDIIMRYLGCTLEDLIYEDEEDDEEEDSGD